MVYIVFQLSLVLKKTNQTTCPSPSPNNSLQFSRGFAAVLTRGGEIYSSIHACECERSLGPRGPPAGRQAAADTSLRGCRRPAVQSSAVSSRTLVSHARTDK